MNTAIFFDTETTGLPDWSAPSESPQQPHMVQLAAILVDMDTKKTLQTLDVIIKPADWTIPAEMTAIHGISQEMAMDLGVSEKLAVEMLIDMVGSRTRIAHNESFDARIIRIGAMRYTNELIADQWKAGIAECTARMTTKICNLPPTAKMIAAKRNTPKTPNLQEAYKHFFDKEFEGAHSALADVMACRDVYFACKAREFAATV